MVGERGSARLAQWLAAGALALAGLHLGDNPDTFGHLAQGRQIVELGRVPLVDTWSLLPGPPRPWHNYEWLSDLLFYGLYAGFGYSGLTLFKCALLFATALLLMTFARRLAGDRAVLLSALALVASIPALRFRLSDRPHVLGMCLAAIYLVSLSKLVDAEGPDARRARLTQVGVLFGLHVLWVNLHGSHLLGVGMTAAFAALGGAQARRPLLALLGLEAVASCISPYGPAIVIDAVAHVFDGRYRALITEWAAWAENDPPWLQLGPALQAALLAVAAPRLLRISPSARAALSVVAVMAISGFRSIRFVGEFLLLSSPLVGAGYAQLTARLPTRAFLSGAGALAVVLGCLVPGAARELPPYLGVGLGALDRELPVGPGMLLSRASRPPRVVAAVQHSWPLMWWAPNARFLVDGRVPFYGPDHVGITMLAYGDMGLFDVIARTDDVNAVVLKFTEQSEWKLVRHLGERPDFSLVFLDDHFALYARDDLRAASGYAPIEHLHPSYALDWVLDAPPPQRDGIPRELERLADVPSAQGYRHWVLGLLELKPLRRGEPRAGFRWPRNPDDRQRYERAEVHLREAAEHVGNIPLVSSLHGLVLATLCDLAAAEQAVARATKDSDPGREAVLVHKEIALRRGELDAVRGFVTQALAMEEGRDDPWLRELESGLAQPPHCPR